MKKVLVTGGAGFIGSHTCVELAEAGFDPVIVDDLRNSQERAIEGIGRTMGRAPAVHRIDCCDEGAMGKMFAAEGPVHGAVHFAADKAVLLRYFNPVGAHHSAQIGELPLGVPNNLVPFVTQSAIGVRKQFTVFGNDYDTPDGSCIRDYILVMDLALAHVRAMRWMEEQDGGVCEVFNIGTDQGNSVLEVINTFTGAAGAALPYVLGPRRAGDTTAVYADTTKSSEVLGWKPTLTSRCVARCLEMEEDDRQDRSAHGRM